MCQQPIIDSPVVLSLISGFAGSIIGGLIAAVAALKTVTYSEYVRRSEKLKTLFREVFIQIDTGKIPHAGNAVSMRPDIDAAVSDLMPYLHIRCKKRAFTGAWNKYRWNEDKSDTPREYSTSETSLHDIKELIKKRLSDLIALLE